MSDFFSRLAQRTLGVEPVVRPDIPPLIGSAPEAGGAPPSAPESDLARIAGGEATEPRNFDRSENSLRVEKPHGPLESRRQPAEAEQVFQPPADRAFAADEPPSASLVSFEARDISSADDGVGGRRAQFRKSPAATEVASLFARHEAVIAPPAFESFAAAPPAIHVSIGRVEVRAVTAPPRPSAPERRAAARLSLEQYLRERNEGRR
jgi:hypothetical protein